MLDRFQIRTCDAITPEEIDIQDLNFIVILILLEKEIL